MEKKNITKNLISRLEKICGKKKDHYMSLVFLEMNYMR